MAKRYYTASFHNGGRKEDSKDTKGNGKSVKFQANREHNIRDEEYCKNQEHIGFKNKTKQEHEEWAKTHVLIDEKPEDAYERIFGEAVKKYDEKQKRSDRKIGSGKKYYEKLKKSKNKVPVYEFIITLGNKDNLPENPEEVRQIYIEALNGFKERNPNFEVIGAYYHDDESRDDGKGGKVQGAPHLHVDYIPVARNRWQNFIDEQNKKDSLLDKLTGKETQKKTRVNGMDVENSLTEALAYQGFISKELDPSVIERKFGIHISDKHYKDSERQAQYEEFMNSRVDEKGKQIKTRLLTAQMQWIKNERDCLVRLFEKHGYKIKNPGEHRPHMETQDFIESKDINIQERNLELYNELSTKIDFIDAEEKELAETKNTLDKKEELLTSKEITLTEKEKELNQREAKQNERDEILDSKTKIVEKAEEQLEEARQINKETEAYRNDIEQIRNDLYQEVKANVNKEYRSKYQQLYDVQESQKEIEAELKKKKEQQEKLEKEQKEKSRELAQRELNIESLEAYKKSVEEKEKEVEEREYKVALAKKNNEEKEAELKSREDTLQQNKNNLTDAITKFNDDCKKANTFYENEKKIYAENQKAINDFNEAYDSKVSKIMEWENASKIIEDENTDNWVDKQFKEVFDKKISTKALISKIKEGVKGFIAKVKKSYDKELHGHKRFFKNNKGENVCEYSFGAADYSEMLLDTPIEDVQKAIDECRKKNKKTFRENIDEESGLSFFERHFKKAKEIKKEIELTLEKKRSRTK